MTYFVTIIKYKTVEVEAEDEIAAKESEEVKSELSSELGMGLCGFNSRSQDMRFWDFDWSTPIGIAIIIAVVVDYFQICRVAGNLLK